MARFVVVIVALVGLLGLANSQIVCNADGSSSREVTESSGTIPYRVGPLNYANDQYCTWVIQAAGNPTSYTISFSFLSLEYQYDSLYLGSYQNGTDELLESYLYGHMAPPPFEFPAPDGTLYVNFTSDYSLNFKGFSFNYTANYCQNPCNNGYCLGTQCVCNEGFSGENCNVTSCGNNCNGHGNCNNGTCECLHGFFGWDCSKRGASYCNGTVDIVGSSGMIFDHHQHDDWTAAPYQRPSDCSWNINTNQSSGLTTVWLTKGQVETPDNLDIIFSGRTVNYATGGFPLAPIIVDSQDFHVRFFTDPIGSRTWEGFTLRWTGNNVCPNGCSGSGHCINGTCSCFGSKTGADCSTNLPVEPLVIGTNMTATLSKYEWKYYRGNLPRSSIIVRISMENVQNSDPYYPGAYISFFLAKGRVPVASERGADLALDFAVDMSYLITGVTEGTWTFGIWGLEATKYKFELEVIDLSGPDATEDDSDDGEVDFNNSNRAGWIAAAVLIPIGIILIALIIVTVILINKRRNARKFQQMNDKTEQS
eukprot:TRINITY_DN718_c0_g1_i2.p1 TRINITY_DN718_c0_g1~~TRINITY_DN718_c0_g1_i2.p1  ORF type:complete len:536 (-),score=116.64 TRINITY_DN718_c0_g1_i2:66-1673(-)